MSALLELVEKHGHHVERGDALSLLRTLPDACVDALITDPPYSSGGQFRGDRMQSVRKKYVGTDVRLERPAFEGDSRDQRSFGFWATLWLAEALRVARPGSPICVFADWRQYPIMSDAIQAGGWVWRGAFPWDKTEAARPVKGRFRNQCEYVLWGSKGPMSVKRRVPVLPGSIRCSIKRGAKCHTTGKPPEVMEDIVRICEPGGIVVDLFAGASSTGVACRRRGLRYLGFEITDIYTTISRERLDAERDRLEALSCG